MEIVNDIGVEKGDILEFSLVLHLGVSLLKHYKLNFFSTLCVFYCWLCAFLPLSRSSKALKLSISLLKTFTFKLSKLLKDFVHVFYTSNVCIHLHFVISSFSQAFKLVKIRFKCFVCYVALLFCLSVLCMLCNLGFVFFVSSRGFQFWVSGFFLSFLCHVFCFCPSSISNSIQFFALGFNLLYVAFMPWIHGILIFKVASLFICV
jgi:hypothetical protein